jgi:hypothetical protein
MGLHGPSDDPQILRGIRFIPANEVRFILPAEHIKQGAPIIVLQRCTECRDGVFSVVVCGLLRLLGGIEQWYSQREKNKN